MVMSNKQVALSPTMAASLTLINGNYSDQLANTCFLVTSSSNNISNSSMPRIAPKTLQDSELLRCKKRIQKGHLSTVRGTHQPAAVARRNERERNRVRLVNNGFATLRQHVPATSKSKKMSKVDTLRSAVEYIKKLQELLGETGGCPDENSYPSSSSSPSPSACSEGSSLCYDGTQENEEELEMLDFGAWF